jgi:hypothetical protein
MSDELYAVLFRDQGGQEYLVFTDENEEAAIDEARRRDEVAFDDAVEKHADDSDEFAEPVWENYPRRYGGPRTGYDGAGSRRFRERT